MDQFYFPSASLLQLSPESMDLSNSTAYPTDSEGPDGLLSIDDSLKELLDHVPVIPDPAFSTRDAEEDSGFNFSFPPLKSSIGIAQRDIDRPTVAEKDRLINILRKRKVNSVVELRRIERALAAIGTLDVTEPMTSAWLHYVNSNAMITELRGLTKNYPFSSECVDEAKRRVTSDPRSNRSWNMCWLVLHKIYSDNMIYHFAQSQASDPRMWGNCIPTPEGVKKLAQAFVKEWMVALVQMLRHWHRAPCRRTG